MDRESIIAEIRQIERDLAAFKQSHAVMHRRALEMEGTERYHTFRSWPVYNIVDNGLILGIVRCEGLLEDYHRLLADMETPDNVVTLETVKC